MDALQKENQQEESVEPAAEALAALIVEIAEDAASLASVYTRDTVVPEGGE